MTEQLTYETGDDIYVKRGVRENSIIIQVNRESSVKLCWRRLDKKTKKLTFNFQVRENHQMKSNEFTAAPSPVELLEKEMGHLQDKLDVVSRNVYLQEDMDKIHFDCKLFHPFGLLFASRNLAICQHLDLDVSVEDAACDKYQCGISLLHH